MSLMTVELNDTIAFMDLNPPAQKSNISNIQSIAISLGIFILAMNVLLHGESTLRFFGRVSLHPIVFIESLPSLSIVEMLLGDFPFYRVLLRVILLGIPITW